MEVRPIKEDIIKLLENNPLVYEQLRCITLERMLSEMIEENEVKHAPLASIEVDD